MVPGSPEDAQRKCFLLALFETNDTTDGELLEVVEDDVVGIAGGVIASGGGADIDTQISKQPKTGVDEGTHARQGGRGRPGP